MKKRLTEKEKDFALTLACMAGHLPGMSYKEGLDNSINLYEELTGDKTLNELHKITKKKKWYQFWIK